MIGPIPRRPSGNSTEALWHQAVHDAVFGGRDTVLYSKGAKVSRLPRGAFVEPDLATSGGGGSGRATKYILADFEPADYLICRPWNADYWTARRELRISLAAVPTTEEILAEMNDGVEPELQITLEDLEAYLAREVLIAKPPELRADAFDEKLVDIQVASWDGATLSAETRSLFFVYHSAGLRTAYDVPVDFEAETQDPEDEYNFKENQTIIPRYVAEETIIHALNSNKAEVIIPGDPATSIRKVDINTAGRHWQRTLR